ncbi:MAG TPA: nucleotide pyrophosphohydrolase [Bacteroidia bacterium]|nr:nucleotide pyrophosphohydrolase [Bacteroidia bacterium]
MGEIKELTKKILEFRDERNWAQFHTGKDLAINLNVEASELLELFLWKKSEDVNVEKLKLELADVFYSALLLAHTYDVDVNEIVSDKLRINAAKYPVDKAKGSNKKYDQL